MNRRGFSFLEVIVAGVLLATTMTISLQMLHATAARHRATEMRQTAISEAANVMQRLGAVPFDKLDAQDAGQMKLSEVAGRRLPGGRLEIELAEVADQPDAKRIVVRIHWQDRTGRAAGPVQLVAWRYREVKEKRETTDKRG